MRESVRRDLAALFLASLLLRAGYVWAVAAVYGLEQTSDFRYMQQLADSLATGRGFTIDGERNFGQAVGYPAGIALVYRLFGIRLELALALNVVAGAASAVLVYVFALVLFRQLSPGVARDASVRSLALTAGVAAAVYPDSWLYAAIFASENLLVPLLLLLLIACLAPWRDVATGVTTGVLAAALLSVKAYGIFLIPFIPAIWWVRDRRMLLRTTLAAIVGVLCLLPWTYLNYRASGYVVPFAAVAGEAFLDGTNPAAYGLPTNRIHLDTSAGTAAHPVALDRAKLKVAFGYIRERPIWYLGLVGQKLLWSLSPARDYLYEHDGQARLFSGWVSRWWPTAFNTMLLAGTLIGISSLAPSRGIWIVGVSLASAATILQMVFFAYPRYRYPFLFALLPFAAYGWRTACAVFGGRVASGAGRSSGAATRARQALSCGGLAEPPRPRSTRRLPGSTALIWDSVAVRARSIAP